VANQSGNVVSGPYICDGTASNTRVVISWNADGSNAKNGRLFMFAGSVLETAAGSQAYNAWAVVSAVFDGSSSILRANAAQVASGNPGATNITALRLGERVTSIAGVTPFSGPWGQFLIYSRALGTDQLLAVERYLASQFEVPL